MPSGTLSNSLSSIRKQSTSVLDKYTTSRQRNIIVAGIFAVLGVVLLVWLYRVVRNHVEGFTSGPEPDKMIEAKRPFLNIFDDKGRRTNIIFITHPFSGTDCFWHFQHIFPFLCIQVLVW